MLASAALLIVACGHPAAAPRPPAAFSQAPTPAPLAFTGGGETSSTATPAPTDGPAEAPTEAPAQPIPPPVAARQAPAAVSTAPPPPAPAPTPTPPPVIPDCTAQDLQLTTATGASTYPANTPITVSTSARNVSAGPCGYLADGCAHQAVAVYDAGGAVVWRWPQPGFGACVMPEKRTLPPGATATFAYRWEAGAKSAGRYTARGSWPDFGPAAPVAFTVTP